MLDRQGHFIRQASTQFNHLLPFHPRPVADFHCSTGAPWQNCAVTPREASDLLEKFRAGTVDADAVLRAFQAAPVVEFPFAQVDTHRALRKGFPEVIFGSGKTPEQVVEIAGAILEREKHLLVTRVTPEHAGKLTARFENAQDSTRPNVLGVHGGDQCPGA